MTSLLIAAMVSLAPIPSQTAPSQAVPSRTVLSQAEQFDLAYRRSAATGRPLVVLLGAKWCPGCKVMQHEVLPAVAKSGGLKQVEFVYIDIDRNRRLAAKLSKAKTIPQLIRYHKTPHGWKSNLLSGAHKVNVVKVFINTGAIRPVPARKKYILPVKTTVKKAAVKKKPRTVSRPAR